MIIKSGYDERTGNTISRGWASLPWKTNLFIIFVLLPTFVAAVYYGLFAANQYVTEFRFNLRSASNPMPQGGSGAGAALGMGMAGVNPAVIWDSHAIVQFIKSREIVDDMQQKIDFRKIYSNPKADFLTRLSPDAPVEKVTEYWQNIVDPFFDMNTGIISVKVRAFTQDESALVAKTVLAQSEELINNLTTRAREDALKYFSQEVTNADVALHKTDDAIREIRNKYGLLDPNRTATLTDTVQSRQEEELAAHKAQYQTVLSSVGPNSPLLPVLKNQISAAEKELYKEQVGDTGTKVVGGQQDGVVMSSILTQYDELLRQQVLREKAFSMAQEALQRARIDFDRQQLYLNAFEHPAMPEMSTYPRRMRSIVIIFGFALLAWILICLGVHAVHDHV